MVGAGGTEGDGIRSTTLSNGLRVLTERIGAARSVAVGYWIRQGAAHEPVEVMGASHLLEHMVFKGTESRTQKEIALSLESLGGHLDAYTSREATSYQARVLDAHLPIAVEVLSDLAFRPLLRDEDLTLEREVVLEEIATVDDTPDDLVFEIHAEEMWGSHGYGHRILGTKDTVGDMTAGTLRSLHREWYTTENAVLVAVGQVDHDELVELAEQHTGTVRRGRRRSGITASPVTEAIEVEVERDSAQTHVVTGRSTVPYGDARRYPIILLSQALGGGMSSRLFQKVREEAGLAYAVYSFQSFLQGGGVEGVYLGTRPETAARARGLVNDELRSICANGLTAEELAQVKEQVKGQVVLSLDSGSARLYRLAGYAVRGEDPLHPDQVLARIDAVDEGRIEEVAAQFFDPDDWLDVTLGPIGGADR